MKYKLLVETHLDLAKIKPNEQGWKAFEYGDVLDVVCVCKDIAVVTLEETPWQNDLTRYHIPIKTLEFA